MSASTLTRIKKHISHAEAPSVTPSGLLPAGVLVPLFLVEEDPHLLFTQRTGTVKHHQDQISFPGGVRDPGDPDLLATALRETEEEIGLKPQVVEVLGTLNPVATVTGFWVNPFVGLIPHPYTFRPNPQEVRQILTFALEEFFPPGRWSTGDYTYEDRVVRVCCWKYEGTVIWGATARMLVDFLSRLGRNPLAAAGEEACVD
jgi:8-oxo-dGTP pyrophosphatase MutT (NUDIX family)